MSSSGTFPFCVLTPNGKIYETQVLDILARAGYTIRRTRELPITIERLSVLPERHKVRSHIESTPTHEFLAIELGTYGESPYLPLLKARNTELAVGKRLQYFLFWPWGPDEFTLTFPHFGLPIREGNDQGR